MYRTILHTEYLRTRILKKSSLERNLKVAISKEKRTKLDPSGKKGIFVGYSESSNAYRIYFPGFKNIDISRDVTFDEDTTYNKSRKKPVEESEEVEAPRVHDTTMNEEDRECEEPQRLVDPPLEKNIHKRKLAWVQELIQGVERYGAPEENHRERKRTRSCSEYVALLCYFIDKEPSNYEEATERKEWKDAMIE